MDFLNLTPRPKKEHSVTRLRDRHHALARGLASGLEVGTAAIFAGYSENMVRTLMGSPDFQNLLQFYRERAEAEFSGYMAKMSDVGEAALDLIADRIENQPEEVTTGQALKIVEVMSDRTGRGPSSKQEVNVNINMAERLQAARKRVLEATRASGLGTFEVTDAVEVS